LASRLPAGESAACAELYDACADGLNRYLIARIGSSADAAERLMEYLQAWYWLRAEYAAVSDYRQAAAQWLAELQQQSISRDHPRPAATFPFNGYRLAALQRLRANGLRILRW